MRRFNGSAWAVVGASMPGSVLMPQSITTEKLVVSGFGIALNADPNTEDITAWLGNGAAKVADTSSPNGTSAIQCSDNGALVASRKFPVDATKNYKAKAWVKQQS